MTDKQKVVAVYPTARLRMVGSSTQVRSGRLVCKQTVVIETDRGVQISEQRQSEGKAWKSAAKRIDKTQTKETRS